MDHACTRSQLGALLLVMVLLACTAAHAATKDWVGGTGNWSVAGNWSPSGAPASADDVRITASGTYTVTMDVASTQAGSLTLGGATGTQTMVIPFGNGLVLTNTTPYVIGTNGVLSLQGSFNPDFADLTVNGQLNFVSGALGSTKKTIISSTGSLTASNASSISLNYLTIENSGTMTFSGTAIVALNFGAKISNLSGGVIDVTADQTFRYVTGAAVAINNAGMVKKSGGSGTTIVEAGVPFTNSGTIEVSSPTLTLNIAAISNLSGSTLTGGTYVARGKLQLGTGSGSITTDAAQITLDGASAQVLNGVAANALSGLTSITAAGQLSLINGSSLALTSALNNAGNLVVSSGSLLTTGTGSAYTQTGGSTTIAGGTMNVNSAGLNINAGVLHAHGTVGGSLTNSGTMDFGSVPATLTVTGGFAQTASGVLNVLLGGTLPGQFGQMNVSGAAALGGALNVSQYGAYTPAIGDSFSVVKYASGSSDFSSFGATLPATVSAERIVTAGSVDVFIRGLPVITGATVSANPTKVQTPLAFTATAAPAGLAALSFNWDFADGTSATGSSATHAFLAEGVFTVVLMVSDGVRSAQAQLAVAVFAPNSGGTGISNVGQGTIVTNPLDGMSIELVNSDGGVLELYVDLKTTARNAYSVFSDFNGLQGRVGTAPGTRPITKVTSAGMLVVGSNATENATGQARGRARKMLIISDREVGQPTSLIDNRNSSGIVMKKLKGKFDFTSGARASIAGAPVQAANADVVAFSGKIKLPGGLDVTKEQDLWLGIGNIVDRIKLGAKGKPVFPSEKGYLKRLKLRYPRLKGSLTAGGEEAQLDFYFSLQGMSTAGFDTEGVSADMTGADQAPVELGIQVGVLLSGVAYQSSVRTLFKTKLGKSSDRPVAGELTGLGRTGR